MLEGGVAVVGHEDETAAQGTLGHQVLDRPPVGRRVLAVLNGFVQQGGDVVVVEPVDDALPAPVADDQARPTQLVGDR
ncbi:hypothetical protein [Spirillospora sp. NBC_01491]|uniref:hypothetical protein n=1 Tax=Spirillospora sp. NBC_01491 TaxID=2976007 RepID=UPI002E353C23|nr:hypothetical protein [Spirillospora sp. NBC_01491]